MELLEEVLEIDMIQVNGSRKVTEKSEFMLRVFAVFLGWVFVRF